MSRSIRKTIEDEAEDEEIDPATLIDTQENKPKIDQAQEVLEEPYKKTAAVNLRQLEYKAVSKLTKDEKDYLINLYKNGGEDEFFKVNFYKNGTNKITRKKQPPKYNTSRRMLEKSQAQLNDKLNDELSRQNRILSNEQLLMEHVIDLETKYATLYQKHKKLKKNYKELRQDIYQDEDEEIEITPEEARELEQKQQKHNEEKQQKQPEPEPEPQQPQYEEPQQQNNYYYEPQQTEPMNYINRLRRPQRGYRGLMAARN